MKHRTAEGWIEFAAGRGVTLRRHGASLRGPCPFHGGRNPTSFSVTPGVAYHCFSCGAAGDLRRLDSVPADVETPSGTTARARTGAGTVRAFFGLDPGHPYLADRGVDLALATAFGIGYFRGRGAFAGRVIIPLHDRDGTLVGHVGRTIDNREPRYRFQRGTSKGAILYNHHRVRLGERLYVVEGIFDALAVHAAGFPNVVGLLGAHATRTQVALLREFSRISVFLDGDDAGREGARALARMLGEGTDIIGIKHSDPASLTATELRDLLDRHST